MTVGLPLHLPKGVFYFILPLQIGSTGDLKVAVVFWHFSWLWCLFGCLASLTDGLLLMMMTTTMCKMSCCSPEHLLASVPDLTSQASVANWSGKWKRAVGMINDLSGEVQSLECET